MTTPTPDEITAALAVLRAVPGVSEAHSLKGIAQIASPHEQLAREICSRWQDDPPHSDRAWVELAEAAHRHGLRITTDPEAPGKLVGYQLLSEMPDGLWPWRHYDAGNWFVPNVDGLDAIRRDATDGLRAAAVYLLPEGGQQ